MAKLDFSSLKTADLRSVAPVDESAIPRAQQLSETEGSVSEISREIPVPAASAQYSAAQPTQTVAVSAPAAPVARAPAHSAHSAKKISLTGLKTGGVSLSSAPAPAPAAVEIPKPVAHSAAPKRTGAMISLGTKPAISLGKKEETETPVAVEAEIEPAVAQVSDDSDRPLVEGVDIIQAAKVIGTEGEAKANEILTESLKDPEAAKKEAEEKAVAAVVIPESSKEFFPNLEMDDDFFKDPLFEGIVPPKPDKKPEVRQPIEMKKEEPEAVAAVEPAAEASETVAETTAEEAVAVETVAEVPAIEEEPALSEEVSADETAAPSEAVLEIPAEAVAEAPVIETEKEAYVEAVAKDLSAERKGGLSKLFGERKVLVRAMAGFFALAVVGVGAFSFVSPSIKTSGPESMTPGTGSETPSPFPKYVPEGETKVVGEGVRVFTGRRPNGHRHKNVASAANTGALSSSGSKTASGTEIGTGALQAPNSSGSVVQPAPQAASGSTAPSPVSETGGIQTASASPVPSDLPVAPAPQPSTPPTETPMPPAPASE